MEQKAGARAITTATAHWVDAGGRLDRLPVGRFHRRLFALMGAGMFFDGFDLYLAGTVMGALVSTGFSDLTLNGWFGTSTFSGMTIGAFIAGWLGDLFGRRFTYQANLAIYGLASLAAAFAPNMQVLIAERFIMGIGLGAEIVVGYATFTEFVPAAVRGRWCGIMAMPIQFSLFAATMTGLLVVPVLGWRPMFLIAGAGALVIWYLRKNLPESPRWLERRGRGTEADALLRRIEAESGVASFIAPPVQAPQQTPVSLLQPALLLRLFVGMTTLSALNIVIFGFIIFIPTFFVQQGLSIVRSMGFSAAMTLGAPVGAVIALFYADRLGRKWLLIGSALMAAVIGSAYPFVGSGVAIAIVGFALLSMVYTNSVVSFAMFVPELFPTEVRLRGTGICNTVGRIVGALTPLVIVPLYQSEGIIGVVMLMVGALVAQAIVVGVWAVEPRHQSLEALAAALQDEPLRPEAEA